MEQRLVEQRRLKEEAEQHIRDARFKEVYPKRIPEVAASITQELTAISSSVGEDTLREINRVVFDGKGKLDRGTKLDVSRQEHQYYNWGYDGDDHHYSYPYGPIYYEDTYSALNGVFLITQNGSNLFCGFVSHPMNDTNFPERKRSENYRFPYFTPTLNGGELGVSSRAFLDYCKMMKYLNFKNDDHEWTRNKQCNDFICSVIPYEKLTAVIAGPLTNLALAARNDINAGKVGETKVIKVDYGNPYVLSSQLYNLDNALEKYRKLSHDQEFLERARRMTVENFEHGLRQHLT